MLSVTACRCCLLLQVFVIVGGTLRKHELQISVPIWLARNCTCSWPWSGQQCRVLLLVLFLLVPACGYYASDADEAIKMQRVPMRLEEEAAKKGARCIMLPLPHLPSCTYHKPHTKVIKCHTNAAVATATQKEKPD